jgi:hypothetical protein
MRVPTTIGHRLAGPRRGILVAVAALSLVATTTTTGAWAAQPAAHPSATVPVVKQPNPPVHVAGPAAALPNAAVPCRVGSKCVRLRSASAESAIPKSAIPKSGAARPGVASPAFTVVPWPDWCDVVNGGIYLTRTDACEIQSWTLQTILVTNDGDVLTGELYFAVVSYAFVSTTSLSWVHQVVVFASGGWGDALGAVVNGIATNDACRSDGSSFEVGALVPIKTPRAGQADFTSPASDPNAISHCQTQWTLLFDTPQYTPVSLDISMVDVRCDNATAGNDNPGCVFPQYPPGLGYSQSAYPSLAAHVAQAQASGLPGASFDAPLYRTTDEQTQEDNYALACGDAPSIEGKSCDEYPMRTTLEGLAVSGGDRRTFDGCGFDDLPAEVGPSGVSICMITATENNAQGGLNTQFFRAWRVLDGDAFRVVVVA